MKQLLYLYAALLLSGCNNADDGAGTDTSGIDYKQQMRDFNGH
jgi:predicted small secreted protein